MGAAEGEEGAFATAEPKLEASPAELTRKIGDPRRERLRLTVRLRYNLRPASGSRSRGVLVPCARVCDPWTGASAPEEREDEPRHLSQRRARRKVRKRRGQRTRPLQNR